MSTHATLSAVPFTASVCAGEQIPVQVTLSVTGDAVNAAEGTLRFDPALVRIVSVSTGRSVFRFWPVSPTVDAEKGTVTFTGGLPTPGYRGDDGLLFTVHVMPLTSGTFADVSWDRSARVLLNDGNGTPADLSLEGARLTLIDAASDTCLAPRPTPTPIVDTISPEPFDVVITRTDDAFRGQYFASYYAYDADSGIVRYEVRENGEAWRIQNSPYLLRTQQGRVVLEVKAVDGAGNQRIASSSADLGVKEPIAFGPWWFWLIALIAVALGLWRFLAARTNRGDVNNQQPQQPIEPPPVTYTPGTTTL